MLFANVRDKTNYFPPSRCLIANLPKDFTKSFQNMKKLQEVKLNKPRDRFDRISKII